MVATLQIPNIFAGGPFKYDPFSTTRMTGAGGRIPGPAPRRKSSIPKPNEEAIKGIGSLFADEIDEAGNEMTDFENEYGVGRPDEPTEEFFGIPGELRNFFGSFFDDPTALPPAQQYTPPPGSFGTPFADFSAMGGGFFN